MSARDLELSLLLKMVDRITNPAKRVSGVTGHLANRLRGTKEAIKQVNQQSRKVSGLQTLQQRLGSTASKMDLARKRLTELHKEQNKTGPSKKLARQIDNARKKVSQLAGKHSELKSRVSDAREELQKSGIDTRRLGQAKTALSDRVDKLNRKLKSQQRHLNLTARAGEKLRGMWSKMKRVTAFAAGGALAAAFAVGRPLINTISEFENYRAILETVEGSSAKAKRSMDWVSKFATKTPFEIGEVTEAFVKMRSFGLDPTNGLLKTLGDTSAAMGKPVIQAVEAIADAVTGENERLKEFGIKAKADGDVFSYEYTDRSGQQRTLSAMKDDRKAIEQVLRRIWEEKYAGAMEKRSKTWSGLMSNLSDQLTRFQIMIMNSGPFDRLKGHLQGLLTKINAMAANGELQRWAETIGHSILKTIDAVATFGNQLRDTFIWVRGALQPLADFVGGWDKLGLAVLSVKFLPVISGLGLATKGVLGMVGGFEGIGKMLVWLSRLAMAHPILALLTGLAAGAIYVVNNWDAIKDAIGRFIDWVVNKLPDWLKDALGISSTPSVVAEVVKASQELAPTVASSGGPSGAPVTPVTKQSALTASAATGSTIQANINIYAQPGDDKRALAEEVKAQLQRLQREDAARTRSKLHD